MADRKKAPRLSYPKRRGLYGYAFIGLWLVGTVIWFLYPLANSLRYSFMDVKPETGGMQGSYVGLKNYIYALSGDQEYPQALTAVLLETLWKTPLILIFSLFIAVLLNQKFKGRGFVRAVFFLPVIIATGPVYSIISGDIGKTGAVKAGQFSTLFSTDLIGELFRFLGIYGLNDSLRSWIETVSDNIFGIVWSSGIQILIFLAALQSIPPQTREAAEIEGATAWEYFWKITLPYVSPMVLACLIFTVIDSFTSPDNAVMNRVLALKSDWEFGKMMAMAWIYFIIVLIAVGVITLIMNHFIYYEVD